jgi:hypothetical protein
VKLLSKTIHGWQTFKSGDVGYFSTMDAGEENSKTISSFGRLAAIDKHVSDLVSLSQDVEYAIELLERFVREVSPPFNCHKTCGHLKRISTISLSPLAPKLIAITWLLQLTIHMQVDDNIKASLSQKTAEHGKALTIIALVSICRLFPKSFYAWFLRRGWC